MVVRSLLSVGLLSHTEKWRSTEAAEIYVFDVPRGAIMAIRKKRGKIWAKNSVESMKDLTNGGRNVHITYDAYCAYLSLGVLQLFSQNNHHPCKPRSH